MQCIFLSPVICLQLSEWADQAWGSVSEETTLKDEDDIYQMLCQVSFIKNIISDWILFTDYLLQTVMYKVSNRQVGIESTGF